MTAGVAMRLIAVAAFAAVFFWLGFEWRDRSCDIATSKTALSAAAAQTAAVTAARTTEQAAATTLGTIGEHHEQAREIAETVPAAVAADLRAGNLRLRREWQGCETSRVSDAAAAARERDALTASRDALAGEIVRIGRDADNDLRAAQEVIRADRAAINGATP